MMISTRIALFISTITLCLACNSVQTENLQSKLEQSLSQLVADFNGDVGIYVRHLDTGIEVAIQADSLFPSASIVKVPILIGIFDMIEQGELAYDAEMAFYTDSVNYPGGDSGLIANHKEGAMVPLNKLTMLMISASDNTASMWLQQTVGGERINAVMERHGFTQTKVNSRTPGREDARSQYGWGQMTPREISNVLVAIRNGDMVSKAASEEMYRNLTRPYYDGEAIAFIPPWVQTASKQGTVNQSKSEVVLVNAPSGDYVFCVVTKNQADTSWEFDNEGYQLIRDVSRLLWNTFEPDNAWQKPAYDIREWW